MADGTDDRSALGSLQAREDFRGTLTTAARRREWMLLSGKLTGRVGRQINNPTLRNVWNTAMATSVSDSKAEYRSSCCSALAGRESPFLSLHATLQNDATPWRPLECRD